MVRTSLSKPVSRILLIAKLILDKDEFLTHIPTASRRDCLEFFSLKNTQGGFQTWAGTCCRWQPLEKMRGWDRPLKSSKRLSLLQFGNLRLPCKISLLVMNLDLCWTGLLTKLRNEKLSLWEISWGRGKSRGWRGSTIGRVEKMKNWNFKMG